MISYSESDTCGKDAMLGTIDYLATCNAMSIIFSFSWTTPKPKRITLCIRKFQSVLIKFAIASWKQSKHFLDYADSIQWRKYSILHIFKNRRYWVPEVVNRNVNTPTIYKFLSLTSGYYQNAKRCFVDSLKRACLRYFNKLVSGWAGG